MKKIYYFCENMKEVGKNYFEHFGQPDDIQCNISETILYMRIRMYKPTEDELLQLSKATIQFKLLKMRGIIFFLVKFGSLKWMDAPYNINLRNLSKFPSFGADAGFFTFIEVFDTSSGKLCLQRKVFLPIEMSEQLVSYMVEQLKEPISRDKMNIQIKEIYEAYSTKELTKFASKSYYITA